ncbi:MAG: hypothetical protein RR951_11435, partial [Ruthenibacterium sp.]
DLLQRSMKLKITHLHRGRILATRQWHCVHLLPQKIDENAFMSVFLLQLVFQRAILQEQAKKQGFR